MVAECFSRLAVPTATEGGGSTDVKIAKHQIWVFPAFIVVLLLAIYPSIWTGYVSLFDWKFGLPRSEAKFVGVANYLRLMGDWIFWESVVTTAVFATVTVALQATLGLGVALMLNADIRGRAIYTALFIIPMVLMDSMVGLTWRLYYSETGIFNYLLGCFFGVQVNWHSVDCALSGIIIAEVWRWTPFFILTLLAGLQAIPRELYEAASVDGASGLQVFKHVSLPLLAPLLTIGLILRFIDATKLFGMIFAMFGGGPGSATETLPIRVYRTALLSRNLGMGMTEATVLLVLILLLGLGFIRVFQKVRVEQQ